jgi:hypothetical protein
MASRAFCASQSPRASSSLVMQQATSGSSIATGSSRYHPRVLVVLSPWLFDFESARLLARGMKSKHAIQASDPCIQSTVG